jgi:H/ACA ribonucleoprotein complex subunit 3
MKSVMSKCPHCGKYTLENSCEACDLATVSPLPARYSPQDKYGSYRRAQKKNALTNGDLDGTN